LTPVTHLTLLLLGWAQISPRSAAPHALGVVLDLTWPPALPLVLQKPKTLEETIDKLVDVRIQEEAAALEAAFAAKLAPLLARIAQLEAEAAAAAGAAAASGGCGSAGARRASGATHTAGGARKP
jgi:hypothetical protein